MRETNESADEIQRDDATVHVDFTRWNVSFERIFS